MNSLFSFFIETENDADIEDLTTLKVPTLTAQAALSKYNNFIIMCLYCPVVYLLKTFCECGFLFELNIFFC